MTARLDVLCAGDAAARVACTVVLIRDQGSIIVVDPGMVAGRRQILDPLARLGVDADSVSEVVFSHHHPDHTLNAALFERARFHDFWAIYHDDLWTGRPADGFELSPSVRLMATPGPTAQDITTLAVTDGGLAACTHLWWSKDGPQDDPLAEDQELLQRSRARLLALAPALIVPAMARHLHRQSCGPLVPELVLTGLFTQGAPMPTPQHAPISAQLLVGVAGPGRDGSAPGS